MSLGGQVDRSSETANVWSDGILCVPVPNKGFYVRIKLSLVLFGRFLVFCGLVVWTTGSPAAEAPTDSSAIAAIPDENVPYGVASGYIVGHTLLAEGNAAEALPYLHMAYRVQPEVVAIAVDFQAALAAEGYFNDALEVVERMVVDHPDSLDFLVQRADLYLKSGKSDQALADLRELRRRGHVNSAILDAEATILAAAGKIDQALDVYRDGLDLLPDEGPAFYLGMTGVLQKGGQDDHILPLMDEALERYPDAPQLWLVKIRVLVVGDRDAAALAVAQRADTHFAGLVIAAAAADSTLVESEVPVTTVKQPPDSFVVELADFYAQRNELDKAMDILQPLSDAGELQLAPSLWLGRLLLGTNHTTEGESLVARILTRWPDSGRGWFLKGKADEGRGDWNEAVPAFAHAVELTPRDPEIRLGYVRSMLVAWEDDLVVDHPTEAQAAHQTEFHRHLLVASTLVPDEDREGQLILGYGFKAMGDYERAVWRFEMAAENTDLRLNALLQKSLCHDLLGQDGKAREDLETLYSEYPQHPEVANSLGYFLAEKATDLDKARDLVEQALAAEPGNGAFLDSMGWIEYRSGELEQALDFLIQAVNVLPDDPVILEHLGMVLKEQGKSDEALDVLRRSLVRGGDAERLQGLINELEGEQDNGP